MLLNLPRGFYSGTNNTVIPRYLPTKRYAPIVLTPYAHGFRDTTSSNGEKRKKKLNISFRKYNTLSTLTFNNNYYTYYLYDIDKYYIVYFS